VLYLAGMCIMAYNTWMTLKGRETTRARIPEMSLAA